MVKFLMKTIHLKILEWFAWGSNTRDELPPIAIRLAPPRLCQRMWYSIIAPCHQLQGSPSQLHMWKNNIIIFIFICIIKFSFCCVFDIEFIWKITYVSMYNHFNLSFIPITWLIKEQRSQQIQIASGSRITPK